MLASCAFPMPLLAPARNPGVILFKVKQSLGRFNFDAADPKPRASNRFRQ
jgi:hypothetical protein